jgi:heat shock protein HslJ
MGHDHPGQPLVGPVWRLVEVVEPSRSWRPTAEVEAVLRLDADGRLSATACNRYRGPVRVEEGVLVVEGLAGTRMLCRGERAEVEDAFVAVMQGEVRWEVDGDELRLDGAGGWGLRYIR